MNDGDFRQTNNPEPSNIVAETAALRPGIKLKKPVYDSTGRLLLDSGQTITESVKQILLARCIDHVLLSPEDALAMLADQVSLRLTPSTTSGRPLLAPPKEKIDLAADVGTLLQMTGIPLKETLRAKTKVPYDLEFSQRLTSRFITSTRTIEAVLRRAIHGAPGDAGILAAVTKDYIGPLVNDIDQVLGTLADASDAKPLVQRSLRMALWAWQWESKWALMRPLLPKWGYVRSFRTGACFVCPSDCGIRASHSVHRIGNCTCGVPSLPMSWSSS